MGIAWAWRGGRKGRKGRGNEDERGDEDRLRCHVCIGVPSLCRLPTLIGSGMCALCGDHVGLRGWFVQDSLQWGGCRTGGRCWRVGSGRWVEVDGDRVRCDISSL